MQGYQRPTVPPALARQAERRAKVAGNGYGYKIIRRMYPTRQEKFVEQVLRRNRAYFEFQPVVFCIPLKRQISPDFLVFSWKGRRLQSPHYIEIDGNTKNLDNWYQRARIEGLKYPVVRIWNKDITGTYDILDSLWGQPGTFRQPATRRP